MKSNHTQKEGEKVRKRGWRERVESKKVKALKNELPGTDAAAAEKLEGATPQSSVPGVIESCEPRTRSSC